MRLVWWMNRDLRVKAVVTCVSKSVELLGSLISEPHPHPLQLQRAASAREIKCKPQNLSSLCEVFFSM